MAERVTDNSPDASHKDEHIEHEHRRRLIYHTFQLMNEFKDLLTAPSLYRVAITSKDRLDARIRSPLSTFTFLASETRDSSKQYYPVSAVQIYIVFDIRPSNSAIFKQCYHLGECKSLEMVHLDFQMDFTHTHKADLRLQIEGYLTSLSISDGTITYPNLVLTSATGFAELVSIASLKDCVGVLPGCFTLEAIVVYYEPLVRWVQAISSTASSQQNQELKIPTVNMTLADRTGCASLELWHTAALYAHAQTEKWRGDTNSPMIRLSFFSVYHDNRQLFQRSCRISGSNIKIESLSSAVSPYLIDSRVHLDDSLFIRRLSLLSSTLPPFSSHLAALVSKVQEVRSTRSSQQIRNFRLIDRYGSYIECRALGRHAGNPLLVDGNEVVVYGASVPMSRHQSILGFLWLLNDAHVILLKRQCRVPEALCRIDFNNAT